MYIFLKLITIQKLFAVKLFRQHRIIQVCGIAFIHNKNPRPNGHCLVSWTFI